MPIKKEHIQVLKTLNEHGMITHHAMESIRGQVMRMPGDKEREEFLRKMIKGLAVKR